VTEANKDVVRRAYQVYVTGDLEALDELVAADYVDHNPVPGQGAGLAGVKRKIADTREQLGGIVLDVADQIAEGDRVASRMVVSGRHVSGRDVTLELIAISELASGKIVAEWGIADTAGLMAQLS